MCCGEEIDLLRTEVSRLLGDDTALSFDLLESKMTVGRKLDGNAIERVRAAVASTGMEAEPWDDTCPTGACATDSGDRDRRKRLLACAAGGILMFSGLAAEALYRGSLLAALAEGGEAQTPSVAVPIYIAAIIAGGWFIFPKALIAARKLRPDMNLLMTLAVIGAAVLDEWLEAASVSFLFAMALLLESWSIGRARKEIAALLDITPPMARFICPRDGDIEEKPVEEVPVGAVVVVRPGERIPLDGIVTKGSTTVNQAPITGESAGVPKKPGDEVFAGTINQEGAIEFRSTKSASDTTLSRIIRMVEEGRSRRTPVEQWVEKFARVYTPLMIAAAVLIALVPPLFGGDATRWFYGGLVVLVIACPCALVISTPVSVVAGLSSAARNGILIKGGAYLEIPARLKAVAFDKTGTLTFGRPNVDKVVPVGDHTEEGLLANIAALETHSTHPLARAIVKHAQTRGINPPAAENFTILPGEGAYGSIEGRIYWIGSHRMLEARQNESLEFHEAARKLEKAGKSLVIMWCDDHVCGLMSVGDEVRPEARLTVASLRSLGVEKVVMITGDNRKSAELIAAATGIDDCRPELLPDDKVTLVTELKEKYGAIAMIGDGINDAPAMAAATVGIAMGAIGSDAAIETADIALMADDLSKLPWLIRHSRKTLRIIRQNIVFALAVKCVFLGLTAAGIATLWGAIAADMGASLAVIFNGLRLLKTPDTTGDTRYPAFCRSESACSSNPRL